ncbi:hypothetical protein ADIS_0231 [Lunatimonas lonarensis]|uniref:Uncharacterized protein n=1 Tax=Lunatimonas lonarensis TaxID=1232681 RepID=R7ZYP6_9BACT|nr:hypothetical protein ADIS_0231 [Lunatimonas lonarensis]
MPDWSGLVTFYLVAAYKVIPISPMDPNNLQRNPLPTATDKDRV